MFPFLPSWRMTIKNPLSPLEWWCTLASRWICAIRTCERPGQAVWWVQWNLAVEVTWGFCCGKRAFKILIRALKGFICSLWVFFERLQINKHIDSNVYLCCVCVHVCKARHFLLVPFEQWLSRGPCEECCSGFAIWRHSPQQTPGDRQSLELSVQLGGWPGVSYQDSHKEQLWGTRHLSAWKNASSKTPASERLLGAPRPRLIHPTSLEEREFVLGQLWRKDFLHSPLFV